MMTSDAQSLAEPSEMAERSAQMITGAQIRAGHALLGWSPALLAQRSRISESTIRRAEAVDGVPKMRTGSLYDIQRALEAGGCLFLDVGDVRDGGRGVRRRR